MNKNRKLIGAMTFVVCLSLLNVFLTLSLNDSYAIDPGIDQSGYPSDNFSSALSNNTDTVNYVRAAYESLSSDKKSTARTGYISSFAAVNNYTTDGTPLYSLMKNAETPDSRDTFGFGESHPNPVSVTDKGILYILGHGYNSTNSDKNIFSNSPTSLENSEKQYVTQLALWLYMVESDFSDSYCSSAEQCNFYNSSNAVISASEIESLITDCATVNGYGYLAYINQLVSEAKNYGGSQSSTIALSSTENLAYTFNNTFTTLTTAVVTPSVTSNNNNFIHYTVELENPNNYDAYLVDSNGTRLSNGNVVNSFKVVVRSNDKFENMDLRTLKVRVFGHFVKDNEARAYHVTSTTKSTLIDGKSELLRLNLAQDDKLQRFADVLFGYLPTEIVESNFTLHNFTKISKVDATTKEELPGATLTVTKEGALSPLDTWTSGTTPHYMYITEDGNYQLCETIAPENYERQTECVTFNVNNGKVTSATMENSLIPVPDTAAFGNKLFKVLGWLFVTIGLCGLGFTYIKKYKNKSSIS